MSTDPVIDDLHRQYSSVPADADAAAIDSAASALDDRGRALEDEKTQLGRYHASVAHALAARLRNGQLGEARPKANPR